MRQDLYMNPMKNYPKHVLYLYTEIEQAMKRNETVLNCCSSLLEANEKIPDNCKYSLATIQAFNQKQRKTKVLVQSKLSIIKKY